MKLAAVAVIATAMVAPSAAQGATLTVDPVQRCYRETETVLLPGSGFTPNTQVDFTRDGTPVPANPPIVSDAVGNISPQLTLPGLFRGQRTLTYTATDTANTANIGTLGLLVTATDVTLTPKQGRPNRLLTISGRGFFGGGRRLWAHVVRGSRGATASAARNVRLGRITGACKKSNARKRLFPANAAPGVYTVQFDAFRRYKRSREVKALYSVTIFRTVRPPAAAAASSVWRRIG